MILSQETTKILGMRLKSAEPAVGRKMVCTSCDSKTESGPNFCGNCGKSLAGSPGQSGIRTIMAQSKPLSSTQHASWGQPRFERLIGPEEAAEYLNCSPLTVRRMAHSARIPAVAFPAGRRRIWKFRLSDLEAHMKTLEQKPKGVPSAVVDSSPDITSRRSKQDRGKKRSSS
jgi:excisionase family DNA binding protein